MDDIAESQDLSKEISEAISNPVGLQNDIDEVSIFLFCLLIVSNIYNNNNIKYDWCIFIYMCKGQDWDWTWDFSAHKNYWKSHLSYWNLQINIFF